MKPARTEIGEPGLKPAPLFLLKRQVRAETTDYEIFCRANARLTWDNVSATIVVRRLLGWFYHFVPDVARALRNFGGNTSRAVGRSLAGQVGDMIQLANRSGMSPREYYEFGLARFAGGEELRNFIAPRFFNFLALACAQRRLQRFTEPPDLNDKAMFESYCAALGAPSVRTLLVIDGDKLTDIRGAACDGDLAECDIFVKPRMGGQGRGTLRFASTERGWYRAMDGKAFSAEALITHLSQLSRESGRVLLVQEALQNSTWLDAVAGRALATTRIITLLDETEEPEVVYASLRTAGSAESIVDNYHAQGVAFPLDIETGELGAGRRLSFADDPQFYPAHPTTGARMQGTRLARWQDAKALATCLHRRCPHLLIAGWDIGFTDGGPRVVEVNVPPGLPIVQMQYGFLGTRYSALLAKHVLAWLEDKKSYI